MKSGRRYLRELLKSKIATNSRCKQVYFASEVPKSNPINKLIVSKIEKPRPRKTEWKAPPIKKEGEVSQSKQFERLLNFIVDDVFDQLTSKLD